MMAVVVLAILGSQAVAIYILPRLGLPPWHEAAAGAGLVVVLLGPILHFFVLRPMLAHIRQRRAAEAELERRVAERTAELSALNQKLAAWATQVEDRGRQILVLSEMGRTLSTCATVEEATATIARALDRLCRGESWALYVYRQASGQLELLGRAGAEAPAELAFAPDRCLGVARGQPHSLAVPGTGEVCAHLGRATAGPYICAPMIAQGETLGVLHLVGPLDESRRLLAVVVAEHVGLALANLRLREQLRSQAVRDGLTGLFNRRYMEESLDREIKRVARREAPLGVLMIDVDHFKQFNDTHGHAAGDALLREVGTYLKEHTRGEDIACRYGGEEFTVILPEANVDVLLRRAEEIRKGIEKIVVAYGGKTLGPVTMSVGAAEFPQHGRTSEALLKAADGALYQAKKEGRNRVIYAGELDTV